jgi:FdhD protein
VRFTLKAGRSDTGMKPAMAADGTPHIAPSRPERGTGISPADYISYSPGSVQMVSGYVVEEVLACISVNGQELATFMCSPHDLEQLALGFLWNEGVISGLNDVKSTHVSKSRTCVDIWLRDPAFKAPKRRIITAGCGGGITFDDLSERHEPLTSGLEATPEQLAGLMREMHLGARLYQQARGIHTAAMSDGDRVLMQVEDVGRHNCLDKLAGLALLEGVDTKDKVLLSSGRISSEMINKARRMQMPIVCSRTSPTGLSVGLADAWQMTIVAYLRQDRMRIYTHPQRIIGLLASVREQSSNSRGPECK